uniref:Sigma factor n=1 Tax=Geranium phaeum TaxID=379952 RepID=A0A0G2SUC1_9ROSI|nr:sigma factor [Geranium phaeum]
MSTTAVIGLSAGKRLLSTSFFGYDLSEKLSLASDHVFANHQHAPAKNVVTAKKSSDYSPRFSSSNRQKQSVNALNQCFDTVSTPSTTDQPWTEISDDTEDEDSEMEYSVDALLLLQKSMLEKQWNLSGGQKTRKKLSVVCSGTSARERRISSKRKVTGKEDSVAQTSTSKQPRLLISPEVIQNKNRYKGYGKGSVSKKYLSHAEVVSLSKKVQFGVSLDKHKLRLQEKLGYEPSDREIAMSLKLSRAELQAKHIECNRAREKLAMSNIRLVISIAKQYEGVSAEMEDLVQGGMVGLLRGIEKFDSSRGFKMSTYVYWWIRQGISKAIANYSRTYRIPANMNARIGLVREATVKLEQKGVKASIANIAQYLNMTEKKVSNATQAMKKASSLDREPFPNLNGIPGHTHHSYVADTNPDNDPRYLYQKAALKEEINTILNIALGEREREIITLYYGLQGRPLTWEEISKGMGLSRERVRQVGLVALEKVRHVAKKRRLDLMLEIRDYDY